MIEEAISECPAQDYATRDQFRSLQNELRILTEITTNDDSCLTLEGLVVKYGWHVGLNFTVLAEVADEECRTFIVLPGQELPSGITVAKKKPTSSLRKGEHVSLDLQIIRKSGKLLWDVTVVNP